MPFSYVRPTNLLGRQVNLGHRFVLLQSEALTIKNLRRCIHVLGQRHACLLAHVGDCRAGHAGRLVDGWISDRELAGLINEVGRVATAARIHHVWRSRWVCVAKAP